MNAKRPRVLVVDTDAQAVREIALALEDRAEVETADNADLASAHLLRRKIDLCIANLELPGRSGLELMKELRAQHPDVGRILVSSHTDPRMLISAINEGAVFRFLSKPLAKAEIQAAFGEHARSVHADRQSDLVLVVDDTRAIRAHLELMLKDAGYSVITAGTGEEALELLKKNDVAVAIVDLEMPGMTGLELVAQARSVAPEVPTIILSSHVHHQLALGCMSAGAFDFMPKPTSQEETLFRLKRAIRERRRLGELLAFKASQGVNTSPLVAQSQAMQSLLARARAVAASDETVLITGETGSGKDALAREIHRLSPRSSEMFFAVNCGALPETLLESELFGHEKGSFTGAVSRRKGYFEMADGGTLFLDELGEMTPATQVKLLRVLEERQFVRLGGSQPVKVDVRVIAATNRKLEEMVAEGKFRSDLYYRLYVLPMYVPPLRERKEDIRPLLELALSRAAGTRSIALTADALDEALRYPWPGNVRELFNAVARATALAVDDRIDSLGLSNGGQRPPPPPSAPDEVKVETLLDLPLKDFVAQTLEAAEKNYLQQLLQRTGGVLGEAAKLAGINRKSVYNKMKAYGLDKSDFKLKD